MFGRPPTSCSKRTEASDGAPHSATGASTFYLRKTDSASLQGQDRVTAFVQELSEDAADDDISVCRADDDGDIETIAALYNAGRRYPKPFGYVPLRPEIIERHGVEIEPDAAGDTPFQYLRERHCTLKGLSDVHSFARDVVDGAQRLSKKAVGKLIANERESMAHTTTEEWAEAPPWTAAL